MSPQTLEINVTMLIPHTRLQREHIKDVPMLYGAARIVLSVARNTRATFLDSRSHPSARLMSRSRVVDRGLDT